MCGRFLLDADYEALIERYQIFEDINEIYEKKIEIFPSDKVWGIQRKEDAYYKIERYHWGIEFNFSNEKNKKKHVINARIETILEKPLFKNLAPCLIPASGYYEWHQKTRNRYLITHACGIFSMAGLVDTLHNSLVIVTCDAGEGTSEIHPRMPVILDGKTGEAWLDNKIVDIEKIKKSPLILKNQETYQQLSLFNL